MTAVCYHITVVARWIGLHFLGRRECDECGEIKRGWRTLILHQIVDHGDVA